MFTISTQRGKYSTRRQLLALTLVFLTGLLLPGRSIVKRLTVLADTGTGSVSLTAIGTPVTENFDTLSNTAASTTNTTLPTGWYITESGGGARDNEQYAVDTGGSNTGDVYSYGSAGATDRALGALRSGTLIPLFGAQFTNNTGSTITSLDVAYTGEEWRLGTAARTDRIDFQISTNATDLSTGTYTDVDSLDFTTPDTVTTGAKNGNSAGDRTALTSTIQGLSIPNGASFFIRWTDLDATSADDGLSVDDFSITPQAGPVTPILNIGDVTQAEGNAATTTFSFPVTLTVPAGAGGVSFTVNTQDGITNPATSGSDYVAIVGGSGNIASGNSSTNVSVTVNGDTTPEPNETFFVNISNITGANAGDVQGLGTISNDDVTLTAIHAIQGTGSASPLAAQVVTTSGIVTGLKSNGFFIQEPDATVDADPNTSEGIFVFTSSAPPAAAALGNSVQVTGTVAEFIPSADPSSPPLTELTGPTVLQLSTGNALPVPITLTVGNTTAPSGTTNPLDTLEEFEGMRVTVASLTAIAPTQGNITESSATASSNGVFYAVVTGVARPFREPGVNISDPLPGGAPANVPRFDENPERLRVDSDGQVGATAINLTAGTILTGVTGVVDFGFRTYTILPDPATPPSVGTISTFTAVPNPTANELTLGSFNMQRFYDNVDDVGGDVVLTATAFNNRLNKASLAIRNVMRSPDVIGIVEMENLATLQAVANKVNNDTVTGGGTNPNYQAYLVEGNDVGLIDVGFLVKAARVSVVDVTQFGLTDTYINPNTGSPEILNDRPPLVLRATIARPAGGTLAFTVIVNHLRSLNGIDDTSPNGSGTEGGRVRAKRRAQAEYLANLIQARQTNDPTEKIISVGDYNAFQFNDGYVDSMGTITGVPTPADQVVLASSDLVNPDLTNLINTAPADQRYSFTFDGNAQSLDHVLVNEDALALLTRYAYGRNNADFPQIYYGDANRPERISDHDMPVAYFSLGSQPAGSVLISEFRLSGPGPVGTSPRKKGITPLPATDEFIELYNNTEAAITVGTTDGSSGWALAASDGVARFIIPNGTVIPARGHFLGVNSLGYSLGGYAAGNGTTATGDATYTNDIPDNTGIALFNTSNPANFILANRLDAVGSASEANTLYKEGAGYPAVNPLLSAEHSLLRNLSTGLPKDTDDNSADFLYVANQTTDTDNGARLGAPGPENLSSPIQRNATIKASLIFPCVPSSASPNRIRDLTPVVNGSLGTLEIRRKFTNNSATSVTRLRFRVVDITSAISPPGTADLRALTSVDVSVIAGDNPCGTGALTLRGNTLEEPPGQPNGGGLNSSMGVETVTPGGPIAPGASVNIRLLLGVQQGGTFRFFINVEALP